MKQFLQLIKPFREMRKIAAFSFVLIALLTIPMGMWGQTTVASYSRSGNSNTTTGGTFSTTFSGKSGYYQDANGDCYMQILNTEAYWTSVPTTIGFEATIGGGTGNHDLTNPVYVSLLDENGDVIDDTETEVTSYITTNTGDSYSISIPVVNNVYGVKLSHEKESGYNVRYYSFTLSFVGEGGTPTTYTVTFDAGDGTFVGSADFPDVSNTVTAGTYTLPSATPATGYTFDGWTATGISSPVTGTYTVSGDVDFTASYSENITPTPGGDLVIDFESAASAYTDWTFSNMESKLTGSITAHGGTYYGTTGGKATASIMTNSAIATPGSLTCYVSKQSTNTTASTWYIQVSSDGSTWTDVETRSATDMSKGEWKEFTADLSSYTNVYVRVYYSGSTAVRNIDDLTLTTSVPSVAAPTFDPVSGTEFGNEGLSVTLNCETEGASIYYTLDGTSPDNTSTSYTSPIALTTTTTINAVAYDGNDYSNVATATYTYIDPNAPGSENNPYTVAQARAAIDAGTGTQGVYAKGVVDTIPTAYSSQYSNITFNFVDEEGDEEFLQAYRCGGTEAANVTVGDTVVVYGNLTKYGTTYEFAQGCTLVSLTHPFSEDPTITVANATVEVDAEEHDGTLDLSYANLTITDMSDFGVQYYDANNEEVDEPDWMEALVAEQDPAIGDGYVVSYYVMENEETTPRTAYFKVFALGVDDYVYSNLVTITQAVNPMNAVITVAAARAQQTGSVVTAGTVTSCVGTTGYIQDATAAICVYGASLTVGDSIRVSGTLSTFKGLLEITSPDFTVLSSGNTVEPTVMTIADINTDYAGDNAWQGWLVTIENATVTAISDQNTTIAQEGNTIVVRGISGVDYAVNDVLTLTGNIGCYNAAQIANPTNVTVQQNTEPSVTVTPATINAPAEGAEGTLAVTYENIPDLLSFDYYFCDANGDELTGEDPDWILAEIQEEDENYSVYYLIDANTGEARTAYFKVYTFAGNDLEEEVYAIVTVTQEAYVAPTIATLPFEFDGGRADIETTDGLTQEGLDSDYGSSPKLKFNTTGDWLLLHFDEEPGTLAFDIKGNGFSGSTFTVQTSADDTIYSDLATYTELGATEHEVFDNLGADVRYIKWIYTEKVQNGGNVALGNITLAKPVTTPVITLAPATVEVGAAGAEGTLTMTYMNMGADPLFDVEFVDENDGTATYDWITAILNEDYTRVNYSVVANDGEARTAYLKVYGLTGDGNTEVYSNIVTVTQAAYVAPPTGDEYALFTGNLVEGDYVIYYNGYAMYDTVVTGGRLSYTSVNPDNDVIITDNASIIWHIAPSGDYWTIYSAEANAYAAGTGVKNKAQLLEDDTVDMALWTVTKTDNGYEFVNKANAAAGVNANLRNNGNNGFACYSTSTGGALSLYKKAGSSTECEKIVLDAEHPTWSQNFDSLTTSTTPFTGVKPECWTVVHQYFSGSEYYENGVDTLPQVYYNSNYAHSGNYSYRIKYRSLVAMPELQLDESEDFSRVRLSMWVRQPQTYYKLQVGVLTDLDDESSFVPVALVDNSDATVTYFECGFESYTGSGRYIAFKNVGGSTSDPYCSNYLDDVTLTLVPEVVCGISTLPYPEGFENYTYSAGEMGVEPDCWTLIEDESGTMTTATKPQVYKGYASSGNYSLRLKNRGVYAMPELNVQGARIQDLKMSFRLRQPQSIYCLQVGVVNAEGEFEVVKEICNTTTGMEPVTVNFSSYAGNGNRIAFRNMLRNSANYAYSYNYIDDIVLDYSDVECGVSETYTENFDNFTTTTMTSTGVEPDCWMVISEDVELTDVTRPQVCYGYSTSGNYSLRLKNRCVYAMPEVLDGVEINNLEMSFQLRQPQSFYLLEVGVVDTLGNFEVVAEVNNTGLGFDEVTVNFANYTGSGKRIAFHNILRNSANYDYSYNYIDDIAISTIANKMSASEGGNLDEMDADRYLESITVYPNPTDGQLHIDAVDVQKVEVFNQMGQLVGVYGSEQTVDLGSLTTGVYMIHITVPQGTTVRKVVKR